MRNLSMLNWLLSAILLVSFLSGMGLARAQDQKPDEKYAAIVDADGYVFLSEDKTIKQIRDEAIVEAKRSALEKGLTYIQSTTKVENFKLVYDLILSESEGFVKVLESKDYGITQDNRYRYWIKAEIEYRLKHPGEHKEEAAAQYLSAPLSVSVWTEKKMYAMGEKIKIFIKGNKDFYARVLYVDAKGNTLQLVPNRLRTDNFFKGGRTEVIPEPFDGFELEVTPPFGREKIIVYASSAPQGEVETSPVGSSLLQIKEDLETVSMRTRGVKITPTSKVSGAEFYENSCEVDTRKSR